MIVAYLATTSFEPGRPSLWRLPPRRAVVAAAPSRRVVPRPRDRPHNGPTCEYVVSRAGYACRSQANQVHYQANPDSPIYEELRGILKKTTGIADVLREALAPLARRIEAAFIYGSIASGKEGPRSDVDLMLVGELKFEDAIKALSPAEKDLRREVNPHVYGQREFRAKLAGKDPFLRRVLEEPKIMLMGDLHDFEKSRGHRTAKAA